MTHLLRVHSDLHLAHVTAVGIIDRFVTAQGLMASQSVRDAVIDLFSLAREWEDGLRRMTELLEECNDDREAV